MLLGRRRRRRRGPAGARRRGDADARGGGGGPGSAIRQHPRRVFGSERRWFLRIEGVGEGSSCCTENSGSKSSSNPGSKEDVSFRKILVVFTESRL